MPGLEEAREGFVGKRERVGVGVQKEGKLLELLPREAVGTGAGEVGGAELEDGVPVAAVCGGEDFGDGEDLVGGGVGGREAEGEVAGGGEAAAGEHGGAGGDEGFGIGAPRRSVHFLKFARGRECERE